MSREIKYQCSKRKCKWIGTDEDKAKVQIDDYLPVECEEFRCPKCGNNEFYKMENPELLEG